MFFKKFPLRALIYCIGLGWTYLFFLKSLVICCWLVLPFRCPSIFHYWLYYEGAFWKDRTKQIYVMYFSIQLFSRGFCKTLVWDLVVHFCVLDSKRFIDVNVNWALFKDIMTYWHILVLLYANYLCKANYFLWLITSMYCFPEENNIKQNTLLHIRWLFKYSFST